MRSHGRGKGYTPETQVVSNRVVLGALEAVELCQEPEGGRLSARRCEEGAGIARPH